MKFLKSLLLIIVILGVLAGGAFLYLQNYYQTQLNSKATTDSMVKVEIPAGSSTDGIATLLINAGLIKDANVFKFYLREANLGGSLKAGKYEFNTNESMKEIVADMVTGVFAKGVKVTLPEGLRYDETVDKIANAYSSFDTTNNTPSANKRDITALKDSLLTMIQKPDNQDFGTEINDFLATNKPKGKNLEGFLYPDTYEFAKDATTKDILLKLLENFFQKTKTLQITNGLTFYNNLVLASIVERESSPSETGNIAGVFLKRMKIGMALGSDVTLLYELKRWKPEPTAQELRAVHAYNTRQNTGLPPTPIGSPGIATISGTATAAPGDYLYFLADSQGVVHYAKDYAGHNQNIQKYLK